MLLEANSGHPTISSSLEFYNNLKGALTLRRLSMPDATSLALVLDQRLNASGLVGLDQRGIILLGLIGIVDGERADSRVKLLPFAEVSADGGRVAGFGMSTGQRHAAVLRVTLELHCR